MPIAPELKSKYPKNWDEISYKIRFRRAGGQCECRGECGEDHGGPLQRCPEQHGFEGVWVQTNQVVLTTAHLDHDPTHNHWSNLRAFCRGCHNRYDIERRMRNRLRNREKRRGQLNLFTWLSAVSEFTGRSNGSQKGPSRQRTLFAP